ncbi:hypothetical protein TYRP_006617 [Tyrophagus putrescentiae]|nr:hypothetical protein TYRP_006617 [Tyrophagus putrescentiae]
MSTATAAPAAAAPSMLDLVGWDAEMANPKTANYEKLYEQMAQAAKGSPENVEIMWRLAYATYSLSLNLTDINDIKAKTTEAFNLAEKVVAIDSNHFQGNMWMAMTAGKLALIGSNIQAKIKYTVAFLRALAVCVRLKPTDPMVLFMEGRLQLALSSLTEEEKAAIQKQFPLPNSNWAEAEAKLRQSIAINGAYIDGYITLAYLLIKAKKYAEAKEVILKGLSLELVTKSDQEVAAELKSLQTRIGKLVPQ